MNVSYVTNNMLDEWQYSAEILIAHFRCVIRGHLPFSQSPEESLESFNRALLDSDSFTYIQKVSAVIESRSRFRLIQASLTSADRNYFLI